MVGLWVVLRGFGFGRCVRVVVFVNGFLLIVCIWFMDLGGSCALACDRVV